MNVLIATLRVLLYVILGLEFARAGIYFLSVQGAVTSGALLGVALLDAWAAVRAYREGELAGIRRAVAYMVANGWRKES